MGKNKDVDALPNFKFRISSLDIAIQFDNTRFFEKSVNWSMKDAKYIPVLMVTAKSDVEDTVKGLDMGAGHYLAKPFDYKELSARVTSLLDLGEMVNCALYSRSTSENFGPKKPFKTYHENTKVRNVLKAKAAKHETRHENQVAGDGFLRCGTYSHHLL